MKLPIEKLNFYAIMLMTLVFIVASCGSSNNVVSNRLVQKRKYNKGWHFNGNKRFETAKSKGNNTGEQLLNAEIGRTENTSEERHGFSSEKSVSFKSANSKQNHGYNDFASAQIYPEELPSEKRPALFGQEECDEIIKRDGEIISAKVLEVGVNEIKYKKCGNADGPTYSTLKNDVFMIKYANGSKDVFEKKNENQNTGKEQETNRQMSNVDAMPEPFSITSMILGLSSMIIFLLLSVYIGVGLGLLGIIFGGIGSGRIKGSAGRFKGKGMAVTGITLGILIAIAFIVILLL